MSSRGPYGSHAFQHSCKLPPLQTTPFSTRSKQRNFRLRLCHVAGVGFRGVGLGLAEKVFGRISRGRPGGYPGGRPDPKTFNPSLGAQENEVLCADVLDPEARTSMTQGGLRKTLCRKTSG